MRTKKRMEITIETDRLMVLSSRKVSVISWCQRCSQRTRMITVDEAAGMGGVSWRTIYRWVESERLHFAETSEGKLLICLESVATVVSNVDHLNA